MTGWQGRKMKCFVAVPELRSLAKSQNVFPTSPRQTCAHEK